MNLRFGVRFGAKDGRLLRPQRAGLLTENVPGEISKVNNRSAYSPQSDLKREFQAHFNRLSRAMRGGSHNKYKPNHALKNGLTEPFFALWPPFV